MKKMLKGFTLIELIVVMAILVILMAAIMQMFKPIRETYVDATLYESQRTSQNGVIQYITESIRYATDLGLYTKDKTSSVENAVTEFTKAYLEANGVYGPGNSSGKTPDPDYSTKYANTLSEMKKNAEVIIIDNTLGSYPFNGVGYTGRILRRKFKLDGSGQRTELSSNAEVAGSDECRLALGAAYYGESSYDIRIEDPETSDGKWLPKEGIKVSVASNSKHGIRQNGVITNNGLVFCKNLNEPINGLFDTSNFTESASHGDGTKVYIVYINDKIEITT
ncbi:MAG: type II secretion system protein [Oscillospiraceae bacterium]